MIDNKLLNEQGGFLLRLMNQSLYGGDDFYDYLDIFKQRDKECSIYYQLAENMDILKKEHDFNYKVKFKKFPEEFKKVDKEHFSYKHFELTHSTYMKIYRNIEKHLEMT